MVNGLGVAQGGFIFALADQAFACSANSVLEGTATVEASISYLSPARVGDELEADAQVAYWDGRRVVVDITVRDGERVVALVRATGRRMRHAP
jgi:acyl-CoA thioesterase